MLAMFLVVLGSFFYVTRRISQFRFMEKVSKGRKWLRILESLVPVLAMFGVLWYTMGMMDALICMIHLVIIWLLCDGVTALLHKKTGKPEFKADYNAALVYLDEKLGLGEFNTSYDMLSQYGENGWQYTFSADERRELGEEKVNELKQKMAGISAFCDMYENTNWRYYVGLQ